jgi:hypothetical protein
MREPEPRQRVSTPKRDVAKHLFFSTRPTTPSAESIRETGEKSMSPPWAVKMPAPGRLCCLPLFTPFRPPSGLWPLLSPMSPGVMFWLVASGWPARKCHPVSCFGAFWRVASGSSAPKCHPVSPGVMFWRVLARRIGFGGPQMSPCVTRCHELGKKSGPGLGS